jgi:hypothetical protein
MNGENNIDRKVREGRDTWRRFVQLVINLLQ